MSPSTLPEPISPQIANYRRALALLIEDCVTDEELFLLVLLDACLASGGHGSC
jgi:hypothetical protein